MDIFGNFYKLKGDKEVRKVQSKAELDFSYSDVASLPVGKIESVAKPVSLKIFQIVIVLAFALLLGRLFTIQVTKGEINQKLAEGNRIRPRILEAARGIISDANGVWLARNRASFALAVYPSDLPKNKVEREQIYARLAELTGLAAAEIKTEAEKNTLASLDEVIIKDNISHDDALILEEKANGLQGVFVAKKPTREYQSVAGMAHLLGYTGIISENNLKEHPEYYSSDKIGKTGLEATYEDYLRGVHGIEQMEVDSKGNVVKILVKEENQQPVSGDNLVLNLDFDLQTKAAEALQRGLDSAKAATQVEALGGVVAIMDVNSGAVKSLVSLPSYDNNIFSTKISAIDYQTIINDPNLPMFNRATMGVYPPGSVSKIILASAGLAEGTITKNTSIVTPAAITIGEYVFPDWKDHSYESTNVERAIAESNNVFFYSLGGGYDKIKGLGIDKIKKYWQLFGLGQPTGIDLTSEASGLLPDAAWKKKVQNLPWYLGDTYHASIGQGDLLVTPLQMLRATAAIANGGKLISPQIVNRVVAPDGQVVKTFEPRVENPSVVPADVIKTVQEGMRLTITDGSARNLSDLPFSVAGKTGTAQFLNNQKTHAWFEAYAPYENPEIAILVMVEGGGGGHEIAAPVAKEILQYYFSKK
ncbi:MAG: penicillin-binding protein 2 [Patescibacteria group bacterium]|jgi:penicillin-binding protein 2